MSSVVLNAVPSLSVVRDKGPTALGLVRAVFLRYRLVFVSLAVMFIIVGVAEAALAHNLIYHYTNGNSNPAEPSTAIMTSLRGGVLRIAQGLMAIQALIVAIFAGATLLTQEFESGVVRYTRTQAAGRRRILLATVVVLAVVITVGGSLTALAFGQGQASLEPLTFVTPWDLRVMLFTLPAYPVLLLAAFALGLFLGALSQRTVRAIAVSFAALAVLGYWLSAVLFQSSVKWFAHVLKTNDPLLQKASTFKELGFTRTAYGFFRNGGNVINWGCTTPAGKTALFTNASTAQILKEHLSCFITYQGPADVAIHQWIWVGMLGAAFVVAIWGTFLLTGGRDHLSIFRSETQSNET